MAAEVWQVGVAVGIQSAFGTVNATIKALTGALDETDGIVLGDRESGDGLSGVALPQIARVARANADVSGTLRRQPSSFERAEVSGLAIAWHLKGNGTPSTPLAGEAKPDPGIDAILQSAGLTGANDTNPSYNYGSDPSPEYATIKLWVGPIGWVFQDCIVETLTMSGTGGGIVVANAAYRVGEIESQAAETFPTFDYGNQATLSAPSLTSAAHTYGQVRDAQTLAITVQNDIIEIPSTNSANGVRLSQEGRTMSASSLTEVDDADSDFDYQKLIATTTNTEDLSWRIGVAAGASDTINGVEMLMRDMEVDSIKSVRAGDVLGQQLEAHGTAAEGGGSELKILFD